MNHDQCLTPGAPDGRAQHPPRSRLLGRISSLLALGAALCCATGSALAADATGTAIIQGRIMNSDNRSYLTNARVEVEGTKLVAYTNRFGEYRLDNVPAGNAKLDIFYTGLELLTRTVNVTAGQTAVQDFELSSLESEGVVKLDSYTVAAHKDTEQKSIAINEQRFAPNLKTVVATDQFGDITEGNIGEFVKFLPGISVGYTASDVRNVSIRGVGPQYTSIMLDGYRVASADSGSVAYSSTGGGTRTVELEQISINNAARVEIVKSRTPDLPADALGGSLNLISKSAFEASHVMFNYRVLESMNSNATSLSSTPGPNSDAAENKIMPGFDMTLIVPVSKKFGFTLSALNSNIFNPQYRSNPQWVPNGTLATVAGTPLDVTTNPFLEKYTMQDGPKETNRRAYQVTADWKVSDTNVLSFRFQDNYYNNFFGNRNMNFDTGAFNPVSYGPDFTNGALGKGSVNFGSSFRNKFGATVNVGTEFVHTGSDWIFDVGVNASSASAHYHDYQTGHFSAVTYAIAGTTVDYANYNGVAPQTITVLNGTGGNTLGNVFDINNPNYKITTIQNNPVDALDTVMTGQASLKRTFSFSALPTTFKAGVMQQEERRDIESYKVGYTPTGALALAGAANTLGLVDTTYNVAPPYIPYAVVWPSAAKLYNLFVSTPALFTPTTAANIQAEAQGSLLFKEQITSAYVMGDTKAMGDKLRLVYGVRYEKTQDQGYGPLAVKAGATTTYSRRGAYADEQYSGTYPSIAATYNFSDNLILRASYNRAVGRPDIGNLVPNVSLPDITLPGQTIKVSNPLLLPEQADNYDLSLEYYFSHVGVISAGVFKKDFTDFWGTSNLVGNDALAVLNSLGVAGAQSYINQGDIVSTQVNVGTARVTGVEFAYQQSLSSYANWMKGFTVFANCTAIHLEGASNADFSAFVSRSVNWGVAYDSRRLSLKLNWNYRGREKDAPTTVAGVTYYEYFAPRLYLDTNLEYRLNPHVALFFNGRNLTDVPQDDQRYAVGVTPDYAKLYRREKFGTAYTLGIKGSF